MFQSGYDPAGDVRMGEGDHRGMGLPADGVSAFSIGILRHQKRQCLCYTPLLEGSTECDSEPWVSQEGLWGAVNLVQFFGKYGFWGEVMGGWVVGARKAVVATDLVKVWPSNATCVSTSRKRLNWSDRTYRTDTADFSFNLKELKCRYFLISGGSADCLPGEEKRLCNCVKGFNLVL